MWLLRTGLANFSISLEIYNGILYIIVPTTFNRTTLFPALEIELRGALKKYANFSGNVVGIYYSGLIGYICRNGWDDKDATVVCRNLNYKGGVALQHRLDKTVPIIASNFNCTGDENHVQDCKYSNTSSCPTSYTYSKQAGVLCYNKTGEEDVFRLNFYFSLP
jgi:hypothetical protein